LRRKPLFNFQQQGFFVFDVLAHEAGQLLTQPINVVNLVGSGELKFGDNFLGKPAELVMFLSQCGELMCLEVRPIGRLQIPLLRIAVMLYGLQVRLQIAKLAQALPAPFVLLTVDEFERGSELLKKSSNVLVLFSEVLQLGVRIHDHPPPGASRVQEAPSFSVSFDVNLKAGVFT
jgi:hypothetical protein